MWNGVRFSTIGRPYGTEGSSSRGHGGIHGHGHGTEATSISQAMGALSKQNQHVSSSSNLIAKKNKETSPVSKPVVMTGFPQTSIAAPAPTTTSSTINIASSPIPEVNILTMPGNATGLSPVMMPQILSQSLSQPMEVAGESSGEEEVLEEG